MDIFIENKYKKWYMAIIERAKTRSKTPDCYVEQHHIIPVSLGGKNCKFNKVSLTAKEHYICHLLLIEMVSDLESKRKMAYAFHIMKSTPHRAKGIRYTSRSFENIRIRLSKYFSGKNNPFYGKGRFGKDNPFYGKKHTEKTKQSIKNAHKGKFKGINNPFYGKKHTKKTKQKISKSRSIPISVEFCNGKKVILKNKRHLGIYLKKSAELGAKLNDCRFKHLWTKYGIKDIKEIKNENIEN
jgi:hypothetical protein